MNTPNPIHITLESLPPRERLQAWWRDLEAKADLTFFTSWSWIGPWLDILPTTLRKHLLIAKQDGAIVGLGVVVKGRAHLMRAMPVMCWRLHATGIHDIDDLTIEYNGFLLDKRCANKVEQSMLDFLLKRTGIKRFEVSMGNARFADLADPAPKGILVRSNFRKSYLVNLERVRDTEGGFLATLSGNTRSQIKRSLNAYQGELGPIRVEPAQSEEQASAFFDELKSLHAQTWSERGKHSGFATSPVAHRFHMALIANAFGKGEVQLLRISAGTSIVGYLYNFVHRGRVIFYQSGFNYGLLDKHDRPGLVCHALAIEHHGAHAGLHWYDFAAGDYRYKTSLAKHHEVQGSHVFQRDGLLPRLDAAVRGLVQRVRQFRARAHAVVVSAMGCLHITVADNADWANDCLIALQA
jgi:CelD/BcsL family acetyltransferase involved in cellulose biosynthesis